MADKIPQQIKSHEAKAAMADMVLKLKKAEMLLSVSKTMALFDNLDEMLEKLLELTTSEVNAERGTIFLNDSETNELFSIVAHGVKKREIRLMNTSGVAGHVFTTGKGLIVQDAHANEFFDRTVDEKTGFVTKNILCTPIRTVKGEIIGVAQSLNKKDGQFTPLDLEILDAMTTQAAIALQSTQMVEEMRKTHLQGMEFFDVVSDVISEIDLSTILNKVMSEATRMLNAERSTLFLNDEKTNELYIYVGEGIGASQIRFPNHMGIAGRVFTSGETINIPHAYADLRFNPVFDKQTGYFTRSMLCVPVVNKNGKTLGVTQTLNRRGGVFTSEDESRLRAFTAQVSIALENAQLFDQVQNIKNYNEAMLESMSNGVLTLNEDHQIVTCNAAGMRIVNLSLEEIIGKQGQEFFMGENAWIVDKIKRVEESQESDITMDAELKFNEVKRSVIVTVLPLLSVEKKGLGSMIMIEDISEEKRVKSTMSRYMDAELADQILKGGVDILGGKSEVATVLFSDIRGFTTLTEELGAQETVSLLNEYFTIMVECIQREGGMLDKFIGDAIMAAFGMPIAHEDDEDRAMRASISMMNELNDWNNKRKAAGKKFIDIGIGLNTDMVVSGNIGSPKRMDYTLIGDGVNLAARLESACKTYSTKILISEYTFSKLKGTYRIRNVDRVIVKGKTEPVNIYEVLDYHTTETFPNMMDVVNQFENGLDWYRQSEWSKAVKAFKHSLKLNPQDKLPQIYIDRCKYMKKHPPGNGWDGVWTMKTK